MFIQILSFLHTHTHTHSPNSETCKQHYYSCISVLKYYTVSMRALFKVKRRSALTLPKPSKSKLDEILSHSNPKYLHSLFEFLKPSANII